MNIKKAFTLMELLVVISIISILSTIVLSSTNQARALSSDSAVIAEIDSVQKAFLLYQLEYGQFPGFQQNSDTVNNVGYKRIPEITPDRLLYGYLGSCNVGPSTDYVDMSNLMSKYIPSGGFQNCYYYSPLENNKGGRGDRGYYSMIFYTESEKVGQAIYGKNGECYATSDQVVDDRNENLGYGTETTDYSAGAYACFSEK